MSRWTMRLIAYGALLSLCASLCGQPPAVRPQFEVASVRPAEDELNGSLPILRDLMRNRRPPGMIPLTGTDRVHLEYWAMLDLIAAAYSVRASQVSGPDWLGERFFNIEAKVPDGTPKEELNAMLQSLLKERFGLEVHRGTETRQGFALTLGRDGARLRAAEPKPAPADGVTAEEQKTQVEQDFQKTREAARKEMQQRMQDLRGNGPPLDGYSTVSWGSITTEELAAQLARLAGAPVTDETGLTGNYSVTIETWKGTDVPGGTVFDAVERLGLKLAPHRVTVETVVVDGVSKTPTAN